MQVPNNSITEKFVSRAVSVAAQVVQARNLEEAEKLIREYEETFGKDNVGVAYASRAVADTGTCVVETDDEETRLKTMLPETSVIIVKKNDIVSSLLELAPYIRERQKDGRISYTSFITGPSRTADIERVGAIGVHGPLKVIVILVEG